MEIDGKDAETQRRRSTVGAGSIGAVVIGRNEGSRLEGCFASLRGLSHVVYADSASTDDSVETAKRHAATVIALGNDVALTAARGRNAGARKLIQENDELEYIQFVDGDCEMSSGWLSAAQIFLDDNPDVAVVCGRRFERSPGSSIYNKLADREWDTPIGQAESCGGDSLVRRSAFVAVNGFADEQTAHEEPEFCARLRKAGWQVWRIDAPMTQHDAAMTRLRQFYRRGRRAGYGMCQSLLRPGALTDSAARSILKRAVAWAVVLPALIVFGLFIDWRLSAALLSLYVVQWLRITWRTWKSPDFGLLDSMKVSGLSLIGKFSEAQGAAGYVFDKLRGKTAGAKSYK